MKKILKSVKKIKKKYNLQRNFYLAISEFSIRNLIGQKRMEWHIQCVERKNCQLRILYLEKLLFRYEGVSIFPHKQAERIYYQ